MGIHAFWQLYDIIIPLILKNSFALVEIITGVIMAADNILAVVMLRFLGAWSDRVDTRLGKRIPFIAVGTLLSVFFMMLVPVADNSRSLPLFILSLGPVLISMGSLGAILSLGMIQVLVEHETTPDYSLLFTSVAVLMIAALLVLVSTVKETKLAKNIAEEYSGYQAEEAGQAHEKPAPEVKKSLTFALMALFFCCMAYNGITAPCFPMPPYSRFWALG